MEEQGPVQSTEGAIKEEVEQKKEPTDSELHVGTLLIISF